MKSHNILHFDTYIEAQGIGSYFWWDILYEYGEWIVCTAFGTVIKNCKSLSEALNFIGYKGDNFE